MAEIDPIDKMETVLGRMREVKAAAFKLGYVEARFRKSVADLTEDELTIVGEAVSKMLDLKPAIAK